MTNQKKKKKGILSLIPFVKGKETTVTKKKKKT